MSIITTAQAKLINAAIPGLSGYQKAVGETVAFVPFIIKDPTRAKLRKWKRAVKAIVDDHEEARAELVKELSPAHNDVAKESPEVLKSFFERVTALDKEKHTLELPTVDLMTELLFDNKNPIPDPVLEGIDPILTPEAVPAPSE